MSYLYLPDFKKLIQTDNLKDILGNDYTLLDQAIRAAETEVTSYLIQKYDLSRELISLDPWARATTYKATQRVYLDATAYSATSAYAIGALALQAGSVYVCNTTIIAPGEAFNAAHWTLIGVQYALFYATLPHPEFAYDGNYKVGDPVWWKDKNYVCKIATTAHSHSGDIQYPNYGSIPSVNVAPDDPNAGVQYWGTGTSYTVAAATLPTDATKWTAGDSRNPQLVNCMIDVSLYTIHSRIAPRNIPDLRVKRYDDTIKWLKNAAVGLNITAALPVKQPKTGGRIRWGSEVRKQNNY